MALDLGQRFTIWRLVWLFSIIGVIGHAASYGQDSADAESIASQFSVSPDKPIESRLRSGRIEKALLRAGEYKTYQLRLNSSQRVEIDAITSNSLDPFIFVFDESGAMVAFDDDSGIRYNAKVWLQGPERGASSFKIVVLALPNGDHADDETLSFELAVRDRSLPVDLTDTSNSAFELEGNSKLNGVIDRNSRISLGPGYSHVVYKFSANPGDVVTASLSSEDFAPTLELRDGSSRILSQEASGTPQRARIVKRLSGGGEFELWVLSRERVVTADEFSFKLDFEKKEVTELASNRLRKGFLTVLDVGEKYSGALTIESPFAESILRPLLDDPRSSFRSDDGCFVKSQNRSVERFQIRGRPGRKIRLSVTSEGTVASRCDLIVEAGVRTTTDFARVFSVGHTEVQEIVLPADGVIDLRLSSEFGSSIPFSVFAEEPPNSSQPNASGPFESTFAGPVSPLSFKQAADQTVEGVIINSIEGFNTNRLPATFVSTDTAGRHCTVTAIGPRVLLTAAHCVVGRIGDDKLAILGGSLQFGAEVTQHRFADCEVADAYMRPFRGLPRWPRNSDDYALCEVPFDMRERGLEKIETIEITPGRTAAGESLMLTGFGCSDASLSNAGAIPLRNPNEKPVLRVGLNKVEAGSYQEYEVIVRGRTVSGQGAIVCKGDSGGGVFAITDILDENADDDWRLVAINAAFGHVPEERLGQVEGSADQGVEYYSYLAPLSDDDFIAFMRSWQAKDPYNRVICGVGDPDQLPQQCR